MLFAINNNRVIKTQQIVVFHTCVILPIIFIIHKVSSEVYEAIYRFISLLVLMFFLELAYAHLFLDTLALFWRLLLIINTWYI